MPELICTVVLKPATDVPGMWVAHCLDVDVVTTGRTADHALEMIREAVSMVVADDSGEGLDPLSRRAPQEFWDEAKRLRGAGGTVKVVRLTVGE